ncbi:MAG: universal stress protein [Inquilinaceae bacterium]
MAQRILAAIDGSDQAFRALDYAIDLVKWKEASLYIIYVGREERPPEALEAYARVEHIPDTPSAIYRAIGEGLLANAVARAEDAGVATVSRHTDFGDPAACILDFAAHHDIDTIVMGNRGLGRLRGLLLGSVSLKVTSHATCTCIVVR